MLVEDGRKLPRRFDIVFKRLESGNTAETIGTKITINSDYLIRRETNAVGWRAHNPTNLDMVLIHEMAHVSFAEALAKGPPPAGNFAVPIFSHGTLVVELYTPTGHDPQKPHARDEIYFVVRGKGSFFDGVQHHSIEAGSFLFVPAGHMHRFESFSSDFAVWVAFYGPEGGESNAQPGE